MRESELGLTGVRVTEFIVGLGAIDGVDGPGLIPVEAMTTLDAAFERGIRVVDVADPTANEETERVVGRWLADHNDVLVAARADAVPHGSDAPLRHAAHETDALLHRFELYVANVPDGPLESLVETLTRLVEDDVAHAWGVRDVDVHRLEALHATADRLGVRGPGWVRDAFGPGLRDDAVQAYCREARLGYTARAVWGEGALGNERLVGLAESNGVSAQALGLWWLRTHPSVTATIVSPHGPAAWSAIDDALALEPDTDLHDRVGAAFA